MGLLQEGMEDLDSVANSIGLGECFSSEHLTASMLSSSIPLLGVPGPSVQLWKLRSLLEQPQQHSRFLMVGLSS